MRARANPVSHQTAREGVSPSEPGQERFQALLIQVLRHTFEADYSARINQHRVWNTSDLDLRLSALAGVNCDGVVNRRVFHAPDSLFRLIRKSNDDQAIFEPGVEAVEFGDRTS